MNTLSDYMNGADQQGDEFYGTVDSLFDEIVHRCPAKDEVEVRKAALEALRNFIAHTGIWKKSYPFSPCEGKVGWYKVHKPTNDNVRHVDSVRFEVEGNADIDQIGLPGVVEFGATTSHDRRPNFGNTGDVTNRIVFDNVNNDEIIFGFKGSEIPQYRNNRTDDIAPGDGFDRAESSNVDASETCQRGVAVCTMGMAFGSERVPSWIITSHGNAIADGAAHILTVGAGNTLTRWGASYQSAIEEVIGRMALGGVHSVGTASFAEGSIVL